MDTDVPVVDVADPEAPPDFCAGVKQFMTKDIVDKKFPSATAYLEHRFGDPSARSSLVEKLQRLDRAVCRPSCSPGGLPEKLSFLFF